MRLLKIVFDFYLNASVHVAFAVSALTGVTQLLLDIPVSNSLLGFVFFSTIVCYNFIKYGVEAEKYLIVYNVYHKYIQFFSFLCFGLACYFLIQLDQKIWWATLMLGLISTLYAIPLLPKAGNLRSLGGMKIFIVALVWAGFTVLLPVLDGGKDHSWDLDVLLAQRFILVLALILPFEIRDLQWDSKELKTLPQLLGIKRTRRFGALLMFMFFVLTFFKDEVSSIEILTRGFLTVLLIAIFLLKREMEDKYFTSFWVEGIPLLWLGMFWTLKNVF